MTMEDDIKLAKDAERKLILKRQKHKPGSATQRFGDWTRKPEIQVLIYNQKWLELGKPEEVEVLIATIENPIRDRSFLEWKYSEERM